METISVNQFRDQLKYFVEKVVSNHTPLRVSRRGKEDFMVIDAQDWEAIQETLYVLQNESLMKQMEASMQTHHKAIGYMPADDEIAELVA